MRRPWRPSRPQLPSPSSCFGVSIRSRRDWSPVWPTLAGTSPARQSDPVTGGEYLQLLKEALPKLTRVSTMLDPTFPGLSAVGQAQVEGEARRLGLTLTPIAAQRPDDVEPALARVVKERPGALWVLPVGPLAARVRRIIAFATKERL